MAAKVDLKGMDVQALLDLRVQVDKRLNEIRTELEKHLTLISGKPSKQSTLRGIKIKPKYKGPNGETWSGRGEKPKWLKQELENSRKKLEDFLI